MTEKEAEQAFFALAESGLEVELASVSGACDLGYNLPFEKLDELLALAVEAGWKVRKTKRPRTLCWRYEGDGIQITNRWFDHHLPSICLVVEEHHVFVTWTSFASRERFPLNGIPLNGIQ